MRTQRIFLMLLCTAFVLCIFSSFSSAQDVLPKHTVVFAMEDAIQGKDVANVLVEMNIQHREKNTERTISSFISEKTFSIELEEGAYEIAFYIDDLSTRGKDYIGKEIFEIKEDMAKNIPLLPIGSVRGTVLDDLNNLVREASLNIRCDKAYADRVPDTTDKFGAFESAYLPIGECQITATFDGAVGSEEVTLQQGDLIEVALTLDKTTRGANISGMFLIVLILLIAGGGIFVGVRAWRAHLQKIHLPPERSSTLQPEEKKVHEQKEQKKLTTRQEDLIITLNEREKKVVEFLLNTNAQSTQAKIRYETGIPKTSLARIFMALERKKIITVETIGKLKKIKLTDWFIEKD